MTRAIDINCDLGEGLDDIDHAIMPYLSQCNIACGGHAGDAKSIERVVSLAIEHEVSIGAHISYPDREHFGRRTLTISEPELKASLEQQLFALLEVTVRHNVPLTHVKPHGALYNEAAKQESIALIIQEVVKKLGLPIPIMCLAGANLYPPGQPVIREGFVDRAYQTNGQLVPRSESGAVHNDLEVIIQQAQALRNGQAILSIDGQPVHIACDSLCIHGDHPQALAIAESIHRVLG